MAAKMILACYPDYGKAPPEYVVNLIDVLSTYPESVMVRLCDLRTGIPAKCAFLPTVAEIVAMGDGFESYDRAIADMVARDEQARIAAEAQALWWKDREEKLASAKVEFPNAYLDSEGRLCQPRTVN